MTKKLFFVITLTLVLAFVAMAADPTGKWTYEQQGFGGRGGGGNGGGTPPPPTVVTLTLKADGATLTGSISRPGRGGDPMVTEIKNGKVSGDTITFATEQPGRGGGDPTTITYKGSVKADSIDLEITRPGRGGGDPTTTKVTAKKATT